MSAFTSEIMDTDGRNRATDRESMGEAMAGKCVGRGSERSARALKSGVSDASSQITRRQDALRRNVKVRCGRHLAFVFMVRWV